MAAAEYLTAAGSTLVTVLRNIIFTAVLVIGVSVLHREGTGGLIRKLVVAVRLVPGVNEAVGWALKRQVRSFLRQVDPEAFSAKRRKGYSLAIPMKGEV